MGSCCPGVGAFPQAMRNLGQLGLADVILECVERGAPLLGICLGMQLLFDSSEEMGGAAGLGLIHGEVTRLQAGGLRIPHIGWNEVRFERASSLTDDLPPGGCAFYHVHSFAARPSDPEAVVGTTEYGERFRNDRRSRKRVRRSVPPREVLAQRTELLDDFVGICASVRA